jgi:HPt (histidine-containing phosphotransfer) domain-containing protein
MPVWCRILADFAEFALPVKTPGDEALRRHLRERTHKLKGSAGMIGAVHVMRFAGEAEKALMDGLSAGVVEAIFKQLAAALTTLRQEVDILIARSPDRAARIATRQTARPNLIGEDLDELFRLLDNQNMAAADSFAALSHSLQEALSAERFDGLKHAIETLEFHRGAELLRAAGLKSA